MGFFKNALTTTLEVADKFAERQNKINELTNILMQKTNGVDVDQARKIAAVLTDQAEITWK